MSRAWVAKAGFGFALECRHTMVSQCGVAICWSHCPGKTFSAGLILSPAFLPVLRRGLNFEQADVI